MGKKILVVDDEKDYQKLVKLTLEQAGFSVTTASDGEEALVKLEKEPPALMILDLNMPRMDGYEVCRRVRSDSRLRALPIIMLTVRRKPREQVKGLELGADDYMTKPFDSQELLARIEAVLRRSAPGLEKEQQQ